MLCLLAGRHWEDTTVWGTPANIMTFPFAGSICSRGGTRPACAVFCVTWSGSADSWDLSQIFQSLNQIS